MRRALCTLSVAGLILISCNHPTTPVSSGSAQPPSSSAIPTDSPSGTVQGCTPVVDVGPYQPESLNQQHVETLPPLDSYPSIPPASGPHYPVPHPEGVVTSPPEIGAMIHSLEHGTGEVWYAPSVAGSSEIQQISSFVAANSDHTIMAPYDYPSEGAQGRLPGTATLALVAWERVQLCSQPSLAAVQSFLEKYRYPTLGGGPYQGVAPEQGVPI